VAKKSPFEPEEEMAVKEHLRNYDELRLLYSPWLAGSNAFSRLIESNDPELFTRTYDYNVTAVTDNAPFFFFTLKPSRLFHLNSTSSAMDWKVNLGVAVLLMLLLISIVAVLAFLVLPLAVRDRTGRHPARALLYFVAVGLGYILVEVSLIQRFVLFLGHPTYA